MNPCPRCHTDLTPEEQGNVVVERCNRCGGHWMDPDDLKTLVDEIRMPVKGPAGRTAVDLTDVRADADCPRCGVPMEPFNYAGDSGVILDKCHQCGGLWLDAGDLERVLEAVSASEKDLDRDVKRFSADFHQAELRQDIQEQRDTRPVDPLTASIVNEVVDSDPGT